MLTKRIIPCLDVDRGRVVKGVKFFDHVDAGDPVAQAARYQEQGADELVFYDITASHEGRGIMVDVEAGDDALGEHGKESGQWLVASERQPSSTGH